MIVWPKTKSLRRINRVCCGPCLRSTSEALRDPSPACVQWAKGVFSSLTHCGDVQLRCDQMHVSVTQIVWNVLLSTHGSTPTLSMKWVYYAALYSGKHVKLTVCAFLNWFPLSLSSTWIVPDQSPLDTDPSPLTLHNSLHLLCTYSVWVMSVRHVALTDRLTTFWGKNWGNACSVSRADERTDTTLVTVCRHMIHKPQINYIARSICSPALTRIWT